MRTENHMTMKQLPDGDQPFKKCERLGPSVLSDAELISILLHSGTQEAKAIDVAFSLLNMDSRQQGLEGLLRGDMKDFRRVKGVGKIKSIQLAAVCELARRLSRVRFSERPEMNTPSLVADYFMSSMSQLRQEELHVMMLDNHCHMICEKLLTVGTVNVSLIDPRDIYRQALSEDAARIILVHNHPSGDSTPSPDDITATKRVEKAGDLIGIPLLDHVVIGHQQYTSLCSEGHIIRKG